MDHINSILYKYKYFIQETSNRFYLIDSIEHLTNLIEYYQLDHYTIGLLNESTLCELLYTPFTNVYFNTINYFVKYIEEFNILGFKYSIGLILDQYRINKNTNKLLHLDIEKSKLYEIKNKCKFYDMINNNKKFTLFTNDLIVDNNVLYCEISFLSVS